MRSGLLGERRDAFIAAATIAFGTAALFVLLQKLPQARELLAAALHAAAPVTVGLGLAFVLNIPVSAAERKLSVLGMKEHAARRLALVFAPLLIAGALAGLCALVLPRLIESARTIAGSAKEYVEYARELLLSAAEELGIPDAEALAERITQEVGSRLAEAASQAASKLPSMTFSAAAGVYRAVLTAVICIHSLVHRDGLVRFMRRAATAVLPKRRIEGFFSGCAEANAVFRRYFASQILSALIIGGLGFLGMKALSLPFAELIAAFCTVGALVPIVGPWASIGGSALIILAAADGGAALRFVIMMLSIQLVEDNLIYPRLIGGAIGMTGLEVLAAVIIGGGLFGLPGLLLAVPTAAVLRRLIRRAVDARNAARAEAGETA